MEWMPSFTRKDAEFCYPKDFKIKSIAEQVAILRLFFPGIGFADETLSKQPLPSGAEGWFAIPKWQSVAKTYSEAVQIVFALLRKHRGGLRNLYEEEGGEYSRLSRFMLTSDMLQILGEQQNDYDILMVPAQFGFLHAGESVRQAFEMFEKNEFGLGAFEVGCMLLTHPEKEVQWEELHINCAGDVYKISHSPFFNFHCGVFAFGVGHMDLKYSCYGSASGFLLE